MRYPVGMRSILLAVVLAGAAAVGCSNDKAKSGEHAEQFTVMSIDEVDKAIAANMATAIDCNGDRTRKKSGVLPGAILISDEELFAASELPADKGRRLVFYCSGPT